MQAHASAGQLSPGNPMAGVFFRLFGHNRTTRHTFVALLDQAFGCPSGGTALVITTSPGTPGAFLAL